MSTYIFSRLLPKLFRGGQAFLSVESILSELTGEQATQKICNLPHSIAQILDHINWWNRWQLEILENNEASPYPESSSMTWREISPDQWNDIKIEFYTLLTRIDAHSMRSDLDKPINYEESAGELLVDFALHTAHHFGQIITIRQALSLWPPKSGGDSW